MLRTLFKRPAAWIALAVPAFLLLAAADLGLRSRGALERAEQHVRWRDYPGEKAAHFNNLYDSKAAAINSGAAAGGLTAEAAARELALAAAERDFLVSESSAKQAYIWYRSAAEDFRSPLNPWAARAARELPGARTAWRAELDRAGTPAESWMLE